MLNFRIGQLQKNWFSGEHLQFIRFHPYDWVAPSGWDDESWLCVGEG